MNDDDWDFFNKSVGKLEKEVITLKKENERLKENIHSMLFTDDVVQDRYDKAKSENAQLKKWCEEFNALEVANENTKLKELLKEVLRHDLSLKEVTELTRKIAQVLGEE